MAFLIGFFNSRESCCVKHHTVSYEEIDSYQKIEASSILRGKRSEVIIILGPTNYYSYILLLLGLRICKFVNGKSIDSDFLK